MSADAGDALVSALRDHNPWWEEGAAAFSLPGRPKSDFYRLARPGGESWGFRDQRLLALVGRRGVGKTTLVHQLVHHRIEAGDAPERFLYLPFDADPLYQLESDEQLRRAVRHYESRVLGRLDVPEPHFVVLDDVHRIEHPSKPAIDGWGTPVAALLDDPDRHVVVTASADVQVERELDRVGVSQGRYVVDSLLPEAFRDYLFALHPDLDAADPRERPEPLRAGDGSLPAVVDGGEAGALRDALLAARDRVGDAERRVRSRVVDYLAMGGVVSYDREGAVASADDLDPAEYDRLREDVRAALYREVPGFESIRTIADLERLCALAARNRGAEPFRYQRLVDLFDVDRRTIADRYLPTLSALSLLSGITEYDNRRPRSVRLYLRDTGLVTALTDGTGRSVRDDLDREADLARVAAFDHTARLARDVGDAGVPVRYWEGRDGTVDFVFEVDGTPVPVGLAYRPGTREETVDALREFLEAYDAPLALLPTGDTVRGGDSIEVAADGVVAHPYWLYLLLC